MTRHLRHEGIEARRSLAKDYEILNRTAIAFIRLASIRIMLTRLTRILLSYVNFPDGFLGN